MLAQLGFWWSQRRHSRDALQRARRSHTELLDPLAAAAHAFEGKFKAASDSHPTDALVVGRAVGAVEEYWATLPYGDKHQAPRVMILGGPGSGKTMLTLAMVLQLRGQPVVVLDGKSELIDHLEEILPALERMPEAKAWFENLRILRPFSARATPPLCITRAQGISPNIIAELVTNAIQDGFAGDLGPRMAQVLRRVAQLCGELRESPRMILRWLRWPEEFARDAQRSADPGLREYGASFNRESKQSLSALASRVDALLFHREAAEALDASGCV